MTTPEPPEQTEPPAPITVRHVWDLKADLARIAQAAAAWRSVATAARQAYGTVDSPASLLTGDKWSGEVADTYHEHRRRLGTDIGEAAAAADEIGAALDRVYDSIRTAQGQLDDSLSRVGAVAPYRIDGDRITFRPARPENVGTVNAAVAEAGEIRQGLTDALLAEVGIVERQRVVFADVASEWETVALGTTRPWTVPAEVTDTYLIYTENGVIINSGAGDDTITVSVDPETGLQVVTVNGVTYYVAADRHVTIRAGQGNDTIEVAPGTNLSFTLIGGSGNDTITGGAGSDVIVGLGGMDTIRGGAGDDRVSAGAGRDYIDGGTGNDILGGGLGDDTIYGMDGADRISGGEGQDYLEGAQGSDIIHGGAGNDMISGGHGDDRIFGNGGADVVYAGAGRDTIEAGSGSDTVYRQDDDTVHGAERNVVVELRDLGKHFIVEGSPEFIARVQADLDMLASSPRGQMMLAALDQAHEQTRAIAADWPVLGRIAYQGDTFTIRETTDENGYANRNSVDFIITWSQHPVIQYNPTFDTLYDAPPVAVLYHEMAHVYDYEFKTYDSGTHAGPDNIGVRNAERQATGLPIDHDGDPSTPIQIDPDHPIEYTENGLREELGAPHRPRY